MKHFAKYATTLILAGMLSSCAVSTQNQGGAPSSYTLNADEKQIADELNLDTEKLADLISRPLYTFNEQELDTYLKFYSEYEPDLVSRVVHYGRKNINQPYELYLLGEFPVETYDPQPLYCLDKSDCVVFSEHAYAMALSNDWPSFFKTLQRIRYKDGEISVITRNHYTEADWDVNNSWLVTDMSAELAGDAKGTYNQKVDRAKFLKNRYDLETDIPVERISVDFVPHEVVPDILDELEEGMYVNIIVGTNENSGWASHVGLITKSDDGTVNFLHSTPPKVREEPLLSYIDRRLATKEQRLAEGKSYLRGFKFLRLNENPMEKLAELDGDKGLQVSFY